MTISSRRSRTRKSSSSIISPEFLKSQFCLNEVGASWALSLPVYPLLVPPLDYGDVRGVLAGVQAAKIDDKEKLNDLRDDLIEKLGIVPLRTSHWERKRDKFLGKLASLLPQVPREDRANSLRGGQGRPCWAGRLLQRDLAEIGRTVL